MLEAEAEDGVWAGGGTEEDYTADEREGREGEGVRCIEDKIK